MSYFACLSNLINMCSATYIHETDMPSGGSGYAYIIWDGTQQKSVISNSTEQ